MNMKASRKLGSAACVCHTRYYDYQWAELVSDDHLGGIQIRATTTNPNGSWAQSPFPYEDQGSQEFLHYCDVRNVLKRWYRPAWERCIFILCKKPQLTSHFCKDP